MQTFTLKSSQSATLSILQGRLAKVGEAILELLQRAVWWHSAQGKRREVHRKPPKRTRKNGTGYVPVLSWERIGGVKGLER